MPKLPRKEQPIVPNGKKVQVTVYSYDPNSVALDLKRTERKEAMIELKPFGCGGVSEAFRIWFLDNGAAGPMQVAKRYKFKMGFAEDHTVCQMGENMAKKFNEAVRNSLQPYPPVAFLLWNMIIELDDEFYSIEDFLPGSFTKYNNIFGAAEKIAFNAEEAVQCNLAAAFSHFTWVASGYNYIILDVQGVGCTYTDIAVVSRKMSQYGYTDTGPENIVRFFHDHKCNELCRALDLKVFAGMKALPPPQPDETNGRRDSKEPKPESNEEWVYLEKDGTMQRYDPGTLQAIREAEEKGISKVRVMVGNSTNQIIDLTTKVHFNVLTGDAYPMEVRRVAGQKQQLLQVELDDKEWHCYNSEFQAEVMVAIKSGNSRVRLTMCDRPYEFDFVNLTQTNLDSGKVRRIRLVEVDA